MAPPTLSEPIESLPRVPQRLVQALARKGLRTVADLLFFFPRDYEDFRDRRKIADLEEDLAQTIAGEVVDVAMWFNHAFMRV